MLLGLVAAVAASTGLLPTGAHAAPVPVPAGAAAYHPVDPMRLLDTRTDGGGTPAARSTRTISLRDRPGIPSDAVAAAVTIVAAGSLAPGFVTAWGDGERPTTSALNIDAAGQTRANFAIVPIASDGTIHVYTHGGGDLVIDLTGVFSPASSAADGRFVGIGPERLLDTRLTGTPLAAGEERTVDVTPAGVPVGAEAAVVSFTAVGPAGWFAAWAPGHAWPGTSVVNVSTPGAPATATAIVPIEDGRMLVTSLHGGDVVIDVAGYMTGPDAPSDADGLFVPMTPTRVYDSRDAEVSGRPLVGGTTITRRMLDRDDAGALAMSITAVETASAGFLTVYPGRTMRPNTATVNVDAGATLATGAITLSSPAGTSVFTLGTMHLVIDVTGYFLATEPVASSPPTVPAAPPVTAPTGPFRPAMVSADGTVARWDPCTSIDVYVDFAGAQPTARADLANALSQATVASGLQFVVHETTSRERSHGTHTLTVLWLTETELPAFQDGAVGIGGGAYSGGEILASWMYIDADDPLVVPGTARSMLLDVMLHELGHALGLAHVDDDTQVMFPYVYERGVYQSGDLDGLRTLGATQGCLDPSGSTHAGFASSPIADSRDAFEGDPLDPASWGGDVSIMQFD